MFDTILIANRGEIAIRVSRAANELGKRTVAVFAEADKLSLHRFKTDESYLIGEGRGPVEAYLSIDEVLRVARASGADAIHPGYGLLSENPDFVDACAGEGIAFIGPRAETMRMLGDKASARRAAVAAGVPVVPATDVLPDPAEPGAMERIGAMAETVGYPLMLKASWGGGGRRDDAAAQHGWKEPYTAPAATRSLPRPKRRYPRLPRARDCRTPLWVNQIQRHCRYHSRPRLSAPSKAAEGPTPRVRFSAPPVPAQAPPHGRGSTPPPAPREAPPRRAGFHPAKDAPRGARPASGETPMSAPAPGGVAAALDHLIAEHEAARRWADELRRELGTAESRLRALAEAISAAARLLPEPERAAARAALSPSRSPAPGTRAAALMEFLRTHEDPFTPSDLAAWLRQAGHPVPAPRDAARLLGRAERRGQAKRVRRGHYRACS